MNKGKVKWFSNEKGYGFVNIDGEEQDIFAHYSQINKEGFKSLKEGQSIEFDLVLSDKGRQAHNIKILD